MSIIEWMIQEGIAKNGFQAAHISEGLKLPDFPRDEQERICRLYRKWRKRTDVKNDIPSWQAYELALAGIDPDDVTLRQIELF